ncbi:MAG: UPF0489 family protein, partial [archaeon GB-1867-035]|nr:UPF0489 family protein [Candidatus Culexmicrobium profundum]
ERGYLASFVPLGRWSEGSGELIIGRQIWQALRSNKLHIGQKMMLIFALSFYTKKPLIVIINYLYLYTFIFLGISPFVGYHFGLLFGLIGILISQAINTIGLLYLIEKKGLFRGIGEFIMLFPKLFFVFVSVIPTYAQRLLNGIKGASGFALSLRGLDLEFLPWRSSKEVSIWGPDPYDSTKAASNIPLFIVLTFTAIFSSFVYLPSLLLTQIGIIGLGLIPFVVFIKWNKMFFGREGLAVRLQIVLAIPMIAFVLNGLYFWGGIAGKWILCGLWLLLFAALGVYTWGSFSHNKLITTVGIIKFITILMLVTYFESAIFLLFIFSIFYLGIPFAWLLMPFFGHPRIGDNFDHWIPLRSWLKAKLRKQEVEQEVKQNFDGGKRFEKINIMPPTYLMSAHGNAYTCWEIERLRGVLKEPAILIHVDAHDDLNIPSKIIPQPKTVEEAQAIEYGIEEFIAPAIYHGLVEEVYIVHPKFIRIKETKSKIIISDLSEKEGKIFHLYLEELPDFSFIDKSIILDIDLDYFILAEVDYEGFTSTALMTINGETKRISFGSINGEFISEEVIYKELETNIKEFTLALRRKMSPQIVTIATSVPRYTPYQYVPFIVDNLLKELKFDGGSFSKEKISFGEEIRDDQGNTQAIIVRKNKRGKTSSELPIQLEVVDLKEGELKDVEELPQHAIYVDKGEISVWVADSEIPNVWLDLTTGDLITTFTNIQIEAKKPSTITIITQPAKFRKELKETAPISTKKICKFLGELFEAPDVIYDWKYPSVVLALILRHMCESEEYTLITHPDHGLSISTKSSKKGEVDKPHVHAPIEKPKVELLILAEGKIRYFIYTVQGEKVDEVILEKEDKIISLSGHSVEFLEKDNKIIEICEGPYLGPDKAKVFLDVKKEENLADFRRIADWQDRELFDGG